MSEFNPLDFCTVEMVDGKQHVTIDPHIMYPATIARIQYVLEENVFPSELIQQRVIDGELQVSTDRAKRLLATAKNLPPTAWQDALTHRNMFTDVVGYGPPRQRQPVTNFASDLQNDIEQVWYRGDALEVSLGWFLNALRCKIGGSNNTILSGRAENEAPDDFYHYQL